MPTTRAKTTTKKKSAEVPESKKTAPQLRKENEQLREELDRMERTAYCPMCGKHKLREGNFYVSTDGRMKSGIVPICKQCILDIARRKDENGKYHEPTKASVMMALEYLDKPFLTRVWDTSFYETQTESKFKPSTDIWGNYIKNIQMPAYYGMRWRDGDVFKKDSAIGNLSVALPSSADEEEQEKERQKQMEIAKEYELNRIEVIDAVGYDPFFDYPNAEDKPRLYGSLLTFLDDEAKQDGMKMRAIIQIVKSYNQIEKINNTIDLYVNDASELPANSGMLTKLSEVVARLNSAAVTLAKDNGISVNNNNNKSKGASTLSGKIKKLTEIGFRDAKINTFDYKTCEGMRQVAELSEEARHKQIGYNDSIAQEIRDIKVERVETLTKERDAALESMRLLLVENMDLKATLKELQGGV